MSARLRWLAALPFVALLCAPGNTALVIQDEGTAVSINRPAINLIGAGVVCVDSAANNRAECTITGLGAASNGFGVIGNAISDVPNDTLTVTDSSSIDFTTTDGAPEDITATALCGGIVSCPGGSAITTSMATSRLLGRTTAGVGTAETITVSSPLTLTGLALDVTAIADGDLASNYSGIGACAANKWASTLNDNAAPTCVQPAFANLSGLIDDTQFPAASGVVMLYSDQDADFDFLADVANYSTATASVDSDNNGLYELVCTPPFTCAFDPDEDTVAGVFFNDTSLTVGETGVGPLSMTSGILSGGFQAANGDLQVGRGLRIGSATLGSVSTGNSVCQGRSPTADKNFEDTDCDFQAGVNIEPETTPSTTSNSETFLTDMQRRLGTTFTTATTVATPCTSALCQVTGLKLDLDWVGAYWIEFQLLTQSTVVTTGMSFGVEYTGTETSLYCVREYPSDGAAAATGIVDDVAATNTGQLLEHMATNVASTLVPNLGPSAGVATVDSTALETIRCNLLTTTAGDLQLWVAAETADTVRVMSNSMVRATPFP